MASESRDALFAAFEDVGGSEEQQHQQQQQEQSFKESFYESGTDWSCLYEADEYGIPIADAVGSKDWVGAAEVSGAAHSTGSCEISDERMRYEVVAGGGGGGQREARVEFSIQRQVLREEQNGRKAKMVQTDLSAFFGVKLKAAEKQQAGSGKRQQDIGPYFGAPALPKEEPLPAKARRVNGASAATGKGARSREVRGKHNVDQPEGYREGSENERQRVMRSCPFYKKIPGTTFTVDAFRYGAVQGCSAYFLTHFHADHYGGLTKWWSHGPIYCTPITARLLVLCLSVKAEWIRAIEVGALEVVDGVEVRMLEANHCPGAALIYFKLQTGERLLHTGDFRACTAMQSYPELINTRINTLYLDTTYCNPRYTFPLQEEAIDFVVRITKDALMQNSRTLIVVGAYSIGKERVYLGLAEALGVNIFADKYRMRVLSSLKWPRLTARLSDDAKSTKLHVLPISHLNPPRLKNYLQGLPKFTSVLGFRPTGWTYSEKVGKQLQLIKPQCSGPITIYGVPYSEHSSYLELQEFVQFLRPDKVIPTVNIGRAAERERMQALFREWIRT